MSVQKLHEYSETLSVETPTFSLEVVTTEQVHKKPKRMTMRGRGELGSAMSGDFDMGEEETTESDHTLRLSGPGQAVLTLRLSSRDLNLLKQTLDKVSRHNGVSDY